MGALLLDRRVLPKRGKLTLSAGVITDATRLAGIEGDGVTYPDSSVGVWPAATNLFPYSSFETDTTGWTGLLSSSISASAEWSAFGGQSLKVVTPGSVQYEGAQCSVAGLATASPSTTYTVSFRVNAANGASMQYVIDGYNAGVRVAGIASGLFTGTGEEQTITNTFATTAGHNQVCLVVRTAPGAGQAITFYLDVPQCETGSIATPYIETDGGTASRVAGTVTIPAGVLDETQMWVAFRMRMGYAYTQNPASPNGQLWFTWGDNSDGRRVGILSSGTTGLVRMQRSDGTTTGSASVSGTWALDDYVTVLGGVSATLVKVALNGGAIQTAAHTAIPVIAATTAQVGGNGGVTIIGQFPATAAYKWAAFGKGPIDDAFSALVNSWGNNDPLPHMFPRSAQLTALLHMNGDGTLYRYAA